MRRNRILLISPTFPPLTSGGADFASYLSDRLIGQGAEVCVVTSAIPDVRKSEHVSVHPVMQTWSWRELPKLLSLIRAFNPDVVDIHFTGSIYKHHEMITFVPEILRRWRRDLRIVLHVEYPEPVVARPTTLWEKVRNKAVELYRSWQGATPGYGTLLRDSDQILLFCPEHAQVFAKINPLLAQKTVVIEHPPAVPILPDDDGNARARGRAVLGLSSEARLIAFYGYVYPNKGLETLLEALRVVMGQDPALYLVIIGGSNAIVASGGRNYLGELQLRARQLGISDRITWSGYLPHGSETPSLYLRAADICVLPFDDGISMHRSSFIAAAAHDLPIVTTEGEHLDPVFIQGENTLLCPPQDPRALADAISRLLHDNQLQERLRQGIHALVQERFSWDRCVAKTMQAYFPHTVAA